MTQDVFKIDLFLLADEAEMATAPETEQECKRLYEEFAVSVHFSA